MLLHRRGLTRQEVAQAQRATREVLGSLDVIHEVCEGVDNESDDDYDDDDDDSEYRSDAGSSSCDIGRTICSHPSMFSTGWATMTAIGSPSTTKNSTRKSCSATRRLDVHE